MNGTDCVDCPEGTICHHDGSFNCVFGRDHDNNCQPCNATAAFNDLSLSCQLYFSSLLPQNGPDITNNTEIQLMTEATWLSYSKLGPRLSFNVRVEEWQNVFATPQEYKKVLNPSVLAGIEFKDDINCTLSVSIAGVSIVTCHANLVRMSWN